MTDMATERAQLLLEEGATLYESGKLYEALACWKQVLVLDPGNEIASEYLLFVQEHFQIGHAEVEPPPPPPPVEPPPPPPPPPRQSAPIFDESIEELDWSELLVNDVSVPPPVASSGDGHEDFFAELSQVIASPTTATVDEWAGVDSGADVPDVLSSLPKSVDEPMSSEDPMLLPSSAFAEPYSAPDPTVSYAASEVNSAAQGDHDLSVPGAGLAPESNRDLSQMTDDSIELMLDLDFRAWEDGLLGGRGPKSVAPTERRSPFSESPADLVDLDPAEVGLAAPRIPPISSAAEWSVPPPPSVPAYQTPAPPLGDAFGLGDPIAEVDIEVGDFDADLDALDFAEFDSRVPPLDSSPPGSGLESVELESMGFAASMAESDVFDIPGASRYAEAAPTFVQSAPAADSDFIDVGAELAMELDGAPVGNDFDLSGGFDPQDLVDLDGAQETFDDFQRLDAQASGGSHDAFQSADFDLEDEIDFGSIAEELSAADAADRFGTAVEFQAISTPDAFVDQDDAPISFAVPDEPAPDLPPPEPAAPSGWSTPAPAPMDYAPQAEARQAFGSDPVPDLSGPMFGTPKAPATNRIDSELEALLRNGLDDLERIETSTPPPPAHRQLITAPPPETDFDALMREARRKQQAGDFSGSLELVEQVLAGQPANAEALRYQEDNAHRLLGMYRSRLGNIARCPKVKLDAQEIIWQSLDHRAGFILSQVDAMTSYEDIIDIAGMPELEATRILARLVQHGVIG